MTLAADVPPEYRLRPSAHLRHCRTLLGHRASTAGEWMVGDEGRLGLGQELLDEAGRLHQKISHRRWYVFSVDSWPAEWDWMERHELDGRFRTRRDAYRALLAAAAVEPPPGYPPLRAEG